MLSTLKTTKLIVAEPVTPSNFKPFGGVISSKEQLETAKQTSANYGTATKLYNVSPIVCTHEDAKAQWNMFRCSPPLHLITDHTEEDGGFTYESRVLERHPHSTQTFLPLGRPADSIAYMVIVAESLDDELKLPDLREGKIKAFTVRGDQAITYNNATWHAPMIALNDVTDFAVFIHETGNNSLDTEEVALETLTVEFSLEKHEDPVNRKKQSEEEFLEEKEKYKGPPVIPTGRDKTHQNNNNETEDVGAITSGDPRFDVKQLKYSIERAYYTREYKKCVELCNAFPQDHKMFKEIEQVREKAQDKCT